MKVLWLCNIVLPDFSQEFGIKRSVVGGWMTGMLHELEKKDDIEICLCFPIYDSKRLKNGKCRGHKYYTFLCSSIESYDSNMLNFFEQILRENRPDIVHIWGTEFPHTLAMILACKNSGILERVVINIQGLVSICAKHYLSDIPEEYRDLKPAGSNSIREDRDLFEKRGEYEIKSLKMIKHVIGRTDWDKACVKAINPEIQYYFCSEILRNAFYKYEGKWKYEKCRKYSIFVSQASYPIKGFHYLLKALPIIIREFPDTHVYVAGFNLLDKKEKRPYSLFIESLMEQLDLFRFVTFLNKLNEEEMIQQYLSANVFVSASTVENSSNSVNEAMIIGTPCVCSYVGGIGSIVVSGENGFLYPYDEPALLAYYICRFFGNKDKLCDKCSTRAIQKMKEWISPEISAAKNMEIYKKILDSN